ncbi:hypothetical protein ACGE0T_10050 [Parabacteroides sp. APC149_11_2_Y6]
MKKVLSILFLLVLFCVGEKVTSNMDRHDISNNQEVLAIANQFPGKQKDIKTFELNKSSNSSLFISARTVQSMEIGGRMFKTTTRQFEIFLLKEQNILHKISETLSITYTLKCSSLRIRAGHWVYVLRKIII